MICKLQKWVIPGYWVITRSINRMFLHHKPYYETPRYADAKIPVADEQVAGYWIRTASP